MQGKIVQQQKIIKLSTIFVVGSLLGLGMYWYIENEDFLLNQKLAYIPDLYAPLLFREVGQTVPFLAALSATTEEEKKNEPRAGTRIDAVPVLVYHGVVIKPEKPNVPLEDFREHMFALKDAGWETVSLEEFQRFMKGGTQLPEKSFLLTFDDGRKDNYYPVDPILRALDYEAVMFVITSQSLGEKGQATHFYLSEKELKHMQSTGRWGIQSHSKFAHEEIYPLDAEGEEGHFYSNLLWLPEEQRQETPAEFQARVLEDLEVSRSEIENSLGNSVSSIAFPFGDFGHNLFVDSNFEAAKSILLLGAQEYYTYGFYQWWEGEGFTQNYADTDAFLIKRIEPNPSWTGEELVAVLDRGSGKVLPYSDTFQQDQGWFSTWGSYDIIKASHELVLRANAQEAGASVILDGSGAWKDYELSARVESPTRTGVFVWVRYQDNQNNAACNFGEDFVHVEQVLNGNHRVIQGLRDITPIPRGEYEVSVRVQGRIVQCLINGQVLVETRFLDIPLDRGGIGFKMWDEAVGKASLVVKQINVKPL